MQKKKVSIWTKKIKFHTGVHEFSYAINFRTARTAWRLTYIHLSMSINFVRLWNVWNKQNRPFAQLSAWVRDGHPVTVRQSPAHESHPEQPETATRKAPPARRIHWNYGVGDWLTVTGCPVSNPGNNCANGLLNCVWIFPRFPSIQLCLFSRIFVCYQFSHSEDSMTYTCQRA